MLALWRGVFPSLRRTVGQVGRATGAVLMILLLLLVGFVRIFFEVTPSDPVVRPTLD